ncbi:hypothetical protein GCM10023165_13000 [Variovorax defluvii]|uniref:Transmembrane protein n=1 Tax=Variovorax defluvii TaxID=913761 RepID=A0ABP8H911_9BURK
MNIKQIRESAEEPEVDVFLAEPVSEQAPEPVAQPENGDLAASFGISKDELADSQLLSKFNEFKKAADERHAAKARKFFKGPYAPKPMDYEDADGNTKTEYGVQRTEPTRSTRLRNWQLEKGKHIQADLKKIGAFVREKTGCPRKFGSTYLTNEGKDDPLGPGNQVPNDYLQAGSAAAKAAVAGKSAFVDPSGSAAVSGAGLVTQVVDMTFASAAHVRLQSEQDKAKDDLNFKGAGQRFVDSPETATSADARNWVKFMEAGDKVLKPTTEDQSTRDAARTRVARTVGSTSLNTAGVGVEVAKAATSIDPVSGTILAVPKMALDAVEVKEGYEELRRRVGQKKDARICIANMQKVLDETPEDHADYAELEALVDCLSRSQERRIRQAKRETGFAEGRMVKGGAGLGATLGGAAAATTFVALGAAPATMGLSLVVPAAVAVAWGVAVAVRNDQRARAEHTGKKRQREAQAVALEMSSDDLRSALVHNSRLRYEHGEGEYLLGQDRFATSRMEEFDARDNEYVALRILAGKIQNMVKPGGRYDKNSPFIKLVHALGIDLLFLLAICKAVEPMAPEAQLDYIQSRLALRLSIKFRIGATETQTPPHVSVFIRHFRRAMSVVHDRHASGLSNESDWRIEVHDALETLYPDRRAGMQAFRQAIRIFLDKEEASRKARRLDATDFTRTLSEFTSYLDELEGARLKALEKGKRLVAMDRIAKERRVNERVAELERLQSRMQSTPV